MVARLFNLASYREMLAHRTQTMLSLLGVAVGVAVMVGVELANESARRAFSLSMEAISGQASHSITAAQGSLPESYYRQLRLEFGLRNSRPVIDGLVKIQDRTFRLLGVDPLAGTETDGFDLGLSESTLRSLLTQPASVLMSGRDQQRLGLSSRQSLSLDIAGISRTVQVVGELRGPNAAALEGLLVADIASAQELLQRHGRLDRIDLHLTRQQAEQLSRQLPTGLHLQTVEQPRQVQAQMTRAFHINLSAMGLLALLVGLLIVYNAMTFSVLRRQPLLGMMRVLGATRQELRWLILRESLVIGLLGSLLGLMLGVLIAHGLISMVTRTINDLYFTLTVSSLLITPGVLVKGFLAGLLATLLAALLPARAAANAVPQAVVQRSGLEHGVRLFLPWLMLAGLLLMWAGWALLQWVDQGLVAAFVALFLVIIGYALLIPLLLLLLLRGLAPLLNAVFGRTGRMAARGISAGISRSGIAVAALSVAVSATVGVGIMVESFRDTVALWLQQTLSSDVYISLPGGSRERDDNSLSQILIDDLATLPGVVSASTSRTRSIATDRGPVDLFALGTAGQVPAGFRFKRRLAGDLWGGFEAGELVLISEALAYHQHLQPGDRIGLETATGKHEVTVAAVYFDYSNDRGVLCMDRGAYATLWLDPGVTTVGLKLAAGTPIETLLASIHARLGQESQAILVRANQAIRDQSMAVFDRTFAITGVLRLLAVGVAFIGILSALLALQMERSREHATLRALGMTPRQLAALVFLECGLMGMLAGLLALPLGWAMSELLIQEINQRAFGWSMQSLLSPSVFSQALVLALVAALLAGLFPAWRLSRQSPAQALRDE